jgi:hypothetical protein
MSNYIITDSKSLLQGLLYHALSDDLEITCSSSHGCKQVEFTICHEGDEFITLELNDTTKKYIIWGMNDIQESQEFNNLDDLVTAYRAELELFLKMKENYEKD